MKKTLALLAFVMLGSLPVLSQAADPLMIELTRSLSRDLFEYNGAAYAQPITIVANASTNSRFYNSAYVPKDVDKLYFRFSLNGMLGFVGQEMKEFDPVYPMDDFDWSEASRYVSFSGSQDEGLVINIKDTAGFYQYLLLNLLYEGITSGTINAPETLPTALGTKEVSYLELPMETLLKQHPLYPQIPEEQIGQIEGLLKQFPSRFPLTSGSDINTLALGVPQLEIGSFMGTELLVRFIPPIDLGETFGDFTFWGIGLKHSISQYFNESDDDRLFDLAVQGVYQGTHLKNYIGVTNAELTADATIWNANIQASKELNKYFTVYSGLAYETISISMDYLYYIPVEIQRQLGLLEEGQEKPTPGYPGDQDPQLTEMDFTEKQIKFTLGIQANISDFDFALDYSFSKFDMFSLGIRYTLDFE